MDHVTDLFPFTGHDRLDRRVNDIGEVIHENFRFRAHARFEPVVGAVDGDGGQIDLQVGIHPAVL